MKSQILLILIAVFLYSCNNTRDKNYKNLMKVKKGMNITEVDSIMIDEPKLIETTFWNDSLFVKYYDPPIGASDDLGIVFNKDSVVVEIKYGD